MLVSFFGLKSYPKALPNSVGAGMTARMMGVRGKAPS